MFPWSVCWTGLIGGRFETHLYPVVSLSETLTPYNLVPGCVLERDH